MSIIHRARHIKKHQLMINGLYIYLFKEINCA